MKQLIKITTAVLLSLSLIACDGDEVCGYVSDNDTTGSLLTTCPGFIQNGDFEIVTGDPNAQVDQDIDLATDWSALWTNGSLADLFDNNTTTFGGSGFVAPTPASGTFAGMWIENSNNPDPTFREGMFNKLTTPLLPGTGSYLATFDYAVMSVNNGSAAIKIAVYGVNFSGTLPTNPTSMQTPSNLDLYSPGNSVFLGEVTVNDSSSNTYTTASMSFNTNLLTMPAGGFTHIMITSTHLPDPGFGKMFMAFDNYCVINR